VDLVTRMDNVIEYGQIGHFNTWLNLMRVHWFTYCRDGPKPVDIAGNGKCTSDVTHRR